RDGDQRRRPVRSDPDGPAPLPSRPTSSIPSSEPGPRRTGPGGVPVSGERPQYGASTGGDIPVCPHHPDRPAYVRCQRCGRPTCPECQRTAAVGVHCVDCVQEATRSRPAVRTSLGGRAAQGSPMLVTWWLVGVNAVVYALQWLGQAAGVSLLQMFAYAPVTTTSEPWRMLTSGFLHSMSSP